MVCRYLIDCFLLHVIISCADCCGLRFGLVVFVVLVLVFRLLVGAY